MHSHKEPQNAGAERMKKRHEEWEKERLEKVRQQVEAGLLTEEEGKERGLLQQSPVRPAGGQIESVGQSPVPT